jgi:lycopene beta-cyclase
MDKPWDAIVIGLGGAGLQLAYLCHLDANWKNKRILFIDPNPPTKKTWCFWHQGAHSLDAMVEKSWSKLHIGTRDSSKIQSTGNYSYRMIDSLSLYDWFFDTALRLNPQWSFASDTVTSCIRNSKQWQITTPVISYFAETIYDSRLSPTDLVPPHIFQHFKGMMIELDKPLLDPNTATFMDFSTTYHFPEPAFVYVLPFSETRALVETTAFSSRFWADETYDNISVDYIKRKFPDAQFQVLSTEKGRIPMAFVNEATSLEPGFYKIGGAAGKIKATTGYAFNRINHHLQCLLTNKESLAHESAGRFKFYDSLLLSIIEKEPQSVTPIFRELFQKNEIEKILRFLDEDSTLTDEIKIFASLPWSPFLKALVRKWR